MSDEEVNVREEHRAQMFRRATDGDLVTKILGPQKDADSVGDGIPMAEESVIKLFRMMGLGKNDVVLEAGYGHYPRLAVLAAFVTQQPTLAFEPFAYEHFKTIMDIRYKDKEGVLTWRYPQAAEQLKESAHHKRKRKAAKKTRSEEKGSQETNEDGDDSNKRIKRKKTLTRKGGKKSSKTTAEKKVMTARVAKKTKKSKKVKKGVKNVKKRNREDS